MVDKFDYIESQQDGDELIEEFGQIGAIRRTVTIPGENSWDWPTTVDTDYPIKVAVLPIAEKDIDGTLIKSGDQQALISLVGLEITPETTYILLINGAFDDEEYQGGEAWMVSSLKTLAPAGITVLFDAVVSR